jgi:hypothetical protein
METRAHGNPRPWKPAPMETRTQKSPREAGNKKPAVAGESEILKFVSVGLTETVKDFKEKI